MSRPTDASEATVVVSRFASGGSDREMKFAGDRERSLFMRRDLNDAISARTPYGGDGRKV